jgi:TorA maturation chaperone TorD
MQHLCGREADAKRRGQPEEAAAWRDRQRAFLRDHLWPWLPRFAVRVSQVKAHPTYRSLTDFMLAFVESEINF